MQRIVRNRRLTPEEAAKYRTIRQRIAEELPELTARHQQWLNEKTNEKGQKRGHH